MSKESRGTLADAYRGFVTFGLLDFVAFLATSRLVGAVGSRGTTLAGVGLVAAVGAVAGWTYFGRARPGLAAGLLGGYALMAIISGGTCTMFLSRPMIGTFNVISGFFLYAGAMAIFGLVLLNRSLDDGLD